MDPVYVYTVACHFTTIPYIIVNKNQTRNSGDFNTAKYFSQFQRLLTITDVMR